MMGTFRPDQIGESMGRFAVVVTVKVKPEHTTEFLPLIRKNADSSRLHEPGCRRFDVCTDPDAPDDILLYELYDDAEAFAEHLTTWHYQEFDAATSDMILDKTVRTFRKVAH